MDLRRRLIQEALGVERVEDEVAFARRQRARRRGPRGRRAMG